MSPAEIAMAIRAAITLVDALEAAGHRIQQLREASHKARALGRDLSYEELLSFQSQAQDAIDKARG